MEIEGIGPAYAEKLESAGMHNSNDLLEHGKTPQGRKDLVEKTGISSKLILEWINLCDLIRIKGDRFIYEVMTSKIMGFLDKIKGKAENTVKEGIEKGKEGLEEAVEKGTDLGKKGFDKVKETTEEGIDKVKSD
ncbi:MAG TPA: DUF4332 domain-containing protein [Nitrosopumilaceae archaeon]|nr:DUF4332 domain-containing protein [Nitrosopumilaceae archaeon]